MSGELLSGPDGVRALLDTSGAVFTVRDVINAVGPDTLKFLQSQLSQDLNPLAVGRSTWSFLLQPTGKLVGFMRVTRTADDAFRLDADPGAGAVIAAALKRFLIRTKCTLDLVESAPVWSVRGAQTVGAVLPHEAVPAFPSMPGFDVFAESAPSDVPQVAEACLNYARISSGTPMYPYELNESTIPNATGLVGLAVSFAKGCYVGQELVERIDSRGAQTPRVLRRLVFDAVSDRDAVALVGGADVFHDGTVRGVLTSAAAEPSSDVLPMTRVVALGYVHRDTEPGSAVRVGDAVGVVSALGDW